MTQTLGIGGALVIIIVGLIFYAVSRYKVVGRETAMIITGSALGNKNVEADSNGKKIKVVVGGGAVVLPVIHRAGTLSLQPSNLPVEAKSIVTKEDVPINVRAVSTIKFYSDMKNLINAAENFLGVPVEHKEQQIREILEGHLKAIIATLTVEEANKDRNKFSEKVRVLAEHDLQKLGIEIVTFNVSHVTDDNGYINALAQKRIAEVKRDSELAKSAAEKEERIGKAQNDKDAQTAEYERKAEIAQARKDNELKLAEYKIAEDTAKADAEIAFSLQTTQRKQELKKQEMQVEIVEREKKIELEEKEIQRKEKEYTATVVKLADAEYYKKVKESEAEKIRIQNQSEALKIQEINKAEAEAKKVELEGLANAKAIKAEGEAEAAALKLKLLAEAEGKEKLADAMAKYGDAAVLEMMVRMLPEYAKAVAEPIGNISKVTVIDSGNGGGISSISGNVTTIMAGLQESLKETTGLDMKEIIENYSGKHNLKGELGAIAQGVNKEVAATEVVE